MKKKYLLFCLIIVQFVLPFTGYCGDYWAIIADSLDTCFSGKNYDAAVIRITADKVKSELEEYFISDSSKKPYIFVCLTNRHRDFCNNNDKEKIDNQLIEILKWEKIKKGNEIYQILIGQASKSLENKLKIEMKNDNLSKKVKIRIKKVYQYVVDKNENKFIILK